MKLKNRIKPIFLLYALIAALLGLLAGPPNWIQWDTESYVKAGHVLLNGTLDVFSTSVSLSDFFL